MNTTKPWLSGPFKIPYPECPPIHYESGIKKPIKKISMLPTTINNNKTNNKKIEKQVPWKEASVKSHELFLWESQKLTII